MQTFVAVAETGGFAAAARRLGVSPPLVTRAVRSLEEHLGAAVLTRNRRDFDFLSQLVPTGAAIFY